MKQPTGFYPRLWPDAAGSGLVSQAGAAVLLETVRAVGLDRALRDELGSWRRPTAVHDPAKVVLDLAVTLALGETVWPMSRRWARSRACSGRWRRTRGVSRTIDTLAAEAERALAAIDTARARARAAAWRAAGPDAPDHGVDAARPLLIDAAADRHRRHPGQHPGAALRRAQPRSAAGRSQTGTSRFSCRK